MPGPAQIDILCAVRLGEVISDRYRIDLPLGEGGMGRVYRATHIQLGATVAIKVLKREAAEVPELAKRFIREARAASKLRGEHVCRVSDVGQTDGGQPYMVMELLEGYDLATLIKNGPVSIDVAAHIISQACAGLAEAHALGIVHRDIKPANLFLSNTPNGPQVKILDFGIATAAATEVLDGRLTRTESVMGSPSYMSPEQMRSARDVDARSDIWSLGVSLYELITGDLPFKNATFSGLAISVATEAHHSVSSRFLGIGAVIDRCLEKRPQDRYTTVADLAAALSPFFVEGVPWAVRVQRTLAHAPEPTQMGDDPARSATMTPQPPASTTNFTAGESLARQLPRRKLWPWLAGIGVAAVTATVLAIVLPGGDDSKPARPAGEPRPADIAAPPKPEVKPIDTGGSGSAGSDVGSVGSGGSGSDHTIEFDVTTGPDGSGTPKPPDHRKPPVVVHNPPVHANPPVVHNVPHGNPHAGSGHDLSGSVNPYDGSGATTAPKPPHDGSGSATQTKPPDTVKKPCRPDDPTCGL